MTGRVVCVEGDRPLLLALPQDQTGSCTNDSFIPQSGFEYLLCARHSPRLWGNKITHYQAAHRTPWVDETRQCAERTRGGSPASPKREELDSMISKAASWLLYARGLIPFIQTFMMPQGWGAQKTDPQK